MGPFLRSLSRAIVATALLSGSACSGRQPEHSTDESSLPTAVKPREAPPDAGAELRVTSYGIGPLRAGMSVAEASTVLGAELVLSEGADPGGCSYLQWADGPEGVLIMVERDRIARVDVRSGTTATEEGARIGDSDERIRTLYEGRVTASPHKYTEGQYLTATPTSPADSEFRLIFETEGGRVTRYRSGKLPQVEYVEGCS